MPTAVTHVIRFIPQSGNLADGDEREVKATCTCTYKDRWTQQEGLERDIQDHIDWHTSRDDTVIKYTSDNQKFTVTKYLEYDARNAGRGSSTTVYTEIENVHQSTLSIWYVTETVGSKKRGEHTMSQYRLFSIERSPSNRRAKREANDLYQLQSYGSTVEEARLNAARLLTQVPCYRSPRS